MKIIVKLILYVNNFLKYSNNSAKQQICNQNDSLIDQIWARIS